MDTFIGVAGLILTVFIYIGSRPGEYCISLLDQNRKPWTRVMVVSPFGEAYTTNAHGMVRIPKRLSGQEVSVRDRNGTEIVRVKVTRNETINIPR